MIDLQNRQISGILHLINFVKMPAVDGNSILQSSVICHTVKSVPFKVHPYIFLNKTAYITYFAIKFSILSSLIFPQIV